MNVFVDAARLIVNLGSLGEQFKGIGGANYSGEYLASSVTSMGADAVSGGLVGYKMVKQYQLARNMSPAERAQMNDGLKDSTRSHSQDAHLRRHAGADDRLRTALRGR